MPDTDTAFPRGSFAGVNGANILAASKQDNFSKYIGDIPPTVGVGPGSAGRRIVYINQGWDGHISSCDSDNSDSFWGVSLFMFVQSPDILNDIDKQIDDGNINCGRIRKGNGSTNGCKYTLKYILSDNNTL